MSVVQNFGNKNENVRFSNMESSIPGGIEGGGDTLCGGLSKWTVEKTLFQIKKIAKNLKKINFSLNYIFFFVDIISI